ncbi:MAG: endonuclease V [Propionibacteriaceae bacterium]|nr:endonuclease V [Propionibacteriaceae bacterium]
MWPSDADSLVTFQEQLAFAAPEPSAVDPSTATIGACWVCFPRGLTGPGTDHDPAWCAAVIMRGRQLRKQRVITGTTGAPYLPGLLALRLGRLIEGAVRSLSGRLDVLLLDATARDHPRKSRAGTACRRRARRAHHWGDAPAADCLGEWPSDQRGAMSPLRIGDSVVGCWLRTQPGVRPLAVHPGWRIDLATAVEVVTSITSRRRTPEPFRRARQLARRARTQQGN